MRDAKRQNLCQMRVLRGQLCVRSCLISARPQRPRLKRYCNCTLALLAQDLVAAVLFARVAAFRWSCPTYRIASSNARPPLGRRSVRRCCRYPSSGTPGSACRRIPRALTLPSPLASKYLQVGRFEHAIDGDDAAPFARIDGVIAIGVGAVEQFCRVGFPFVARHGVVAVAIPAAGRHQEHAVGIRYRLRAGDRADRAHR